MDSLRSKFLAAGFSNISFEFGQIYLCDDKELMFPDEKLLRKRELHDKRPVLVVQDNEFNNNPAFPLIMITPISTKVIYKTYMDFELKKGKDPVKEDCYVRLYLTQPTLKTNLVSFVGKLVQDRIDEIKAIYIDYLGLA